ncbi:MAG: peptidylprolyl isomerase [Cohaesibacteraceae bacterium]|nr:peptidylprolyl isomerase [Cohaesibacteraceae bacterium]
MKQQSKRWSLALSAIIACGMLSTGKLQAQDTIAARIGDTVITEQEITFARGDFAQHLEKIPPEQQRTAILDVLTDMHLLAREARNLGIDESPEFKARLAFLYERALRNEYFRTQIGGKVTEADVRARYEKEILGQPQDEEVHARHILVKTKDEAIALIVELDGGADFIELAKKHSTGPSGPRGGDLGFFGKGQMVPPFEEVAFKLQPGAHTPTPVKTQFGWHVLKLEEKRLKPHPSFEQLAQRIRGSMINELYGKKMEELKSKTKIEIIQ